MIERKIFLKTLEDVKAFVNIAVDCKYDIELLSGKYVVNGKSIMGVLSLDLTMPITLNAHIESDADFENQLEPFIYQPAPAIKQ